MLRENLKDAAEILSNILTQPLEIAEVDAPISLLDCVMNYSAERPEGSSLSKLLQTFARNPEPTETLIRELEILSKELR